MAQLPKNWGENDLLRLLFRHVVPIFLRFEKGSEQHHVVFT